MRHPDVKLSPVVGLICAYEEEAASGRAGRHADEACGLAVTTLVVVDGGSDKTDQVAKDSEALTFCSTRTLATGTPCGWVMRCA